MKSTKKFRLFSKIRAIFSKIKEKFKKVLDKDDLDFIKPFVLGSSIYGIMANFIAWLFFRLSFTWYSWLAYTFVIMIIDQRLIKWIRRIRFQR